MRFCTQERKLDVMRGIYLAVVADIEYFVGEALAFHFCPDVHDARNADLFQLIFEHEGFSLRSKVYALQRLLKRQYPDLWTGYRKAFKMLGAVMDYRNMMAHSGVAIGPDHRLVFVAFRSGSPHAVPTLNETHRSKLREAKEVREQLEKLWLRISERSSNTKRLPIERRE